MAESDVELGVKKVAGLEVREEEEKRDLHPVRCHECEGMNKFESENCSSCGPVLETSELFAEVQVEESLKKLNQRIVEGRAGLDDEKINQHAKEIVAEDLGVDVNQL